VNCTYVFCRMHAAVLSRDIYERGVLAKRVAETRLQ